MHHYERWIVQRYLANALKDNRFAKAPHADKDIVAWLDRCGRSFALPEFECRRATRGRSKFNDETRSKDGWKAWRSQVVALARAPAPNPSPLQRRIEWLTNACSLTPSEGWILGLFARIAYLSSVRDLVAAINDRLNLDFGVLGASELRPFLEAGFERSNLSASERLAQLGLIDARDEPRLSGVVRQVVSLKRLSVRNVSDLLLGKAAPASLGWHDFAHLGDMRELAARIVGTSGKSRGAPGTGANILFYGPPGTGKSEFAKTLGARLGFSVQFAGEASEDNAEPNRRERIAALMIANAIGGVARKTIIVVDEADDLFAGVDEDDASTRHGSKVFMNRLVERTATPTIWITNDIGLLGPAVVRRMNLVLRFSRPGLAVRKKMVELSKGLE